MSLFINPIVRAQDADGTTLSGAKWYFYLSGTSTLASVYTDSSLETEHENPVVADSGGLFAPIYLSGGVDYRAVQKTAAGVTIQDIDPYNPGGAATAGAFYDAAANGLVGDGVTDNLAALNAIIALVSANNEHSKPGGPVIWFPPGRYYFSGPINLKKQVTFIGGSNGMAGSGQSTVFVFSGRGIICNHAQTNNGDTIVASGGSADGSVFINLDLFGDNSGSLSTNHGIYTKVRIRLESCSARSFGGHGLYIAGDGNIAAPTTYGNANNTRVIGGHYEGNLGDGIKIEGGDANNCLVMGADATYNGGSGMIDASFLGGTFIGCHTSDNGMMGISRSTAPGTVTYSSDQWYVVPGGEAAASTTAPGADITVWRRMITAIGVRGTPNTQAPTWVSGTTYRVGLCYAALGSGANRTGFEGCYSEAGQGPAFLVQPAYAKGGTMGAGVDGTGGWERILLGHAVNHIATGFELNNGTDHWWARMGALPADGLTFSKMGHSVKAPQSWGYRLNGNNLIFDYAREPANGRMTITGPVTTDQFGTGAAVPHMLWIDKFALGAPIAEARIITNGTAAPTTGAHARGEIVLNSAPSAGGKIGWVCTTAGTPGTWKEWGAIDA